ncbi:MAG: hypothetical protein AABY26_05395, partial [Nanoarchaeota archaeon]
KGKEDNEEVRREYHLMSLNRNIRWLYFLMKWFDRSGEEQHLNDFNTHLNGAYRAIGQLGQFNEFKVPLQEIETAIRKKVEL